MSFLTRIFGKIKVGKAVGDALKAQVLPQLDKNAKAYVKSRLYAIEKGLQGMASAKEVLAAQDALAALLEWVDE